MKVSRSLFAGVLIAAALAAGCESKPTQPVVQIPLSSLTLSPSADTLYVGDQQAFTAVAVDTNDAVVPNPRLVWTSGNAAVFTVSRAGMVSAVNEGTALLVVSSGGVSDTAAVLVLPAATGWFAQRSGESVALNAVFFLPDGNTGWVVGSTGRILTTATAGRTWSPQPSSTTLTLRAVWFTAPGEGWVVGNQGVVLHTTNAGTVWTRVYPGTTTDLLDVTFAARDTGWVAGGGGLVMRTFDRGVTWQKSYPTTATLRGVAFAGSRDGWAVGDGGVILGTHDRGVSWFIWQPRGMPQNLRAVSRPSLIRACAVGDLGSTPRTVAGSDSVIWEDRSTSASNQLMGVHFVNDSTGFAAGYSSTGVVLRTDDGGLTWSPQAAGAQFRLNDVFFIDAQRGWAVGDNGVVLHTVTGGAP